MAAKKKQGLEYFKLDTTLTDRERYLLSVGGPDMLCAWFLIRMEIFRVGCCFCWGEIEQKSFASTFNYTTENLSDIIQELCKAKLLNENILKTEGYLTSKDIQLLYIQACALAKRKEIRIPEEVNLLDSDDLEGLTVIFINIRKKRERESKGFPQSCHNLSLNIQESFRNVSGSIKEPAKGFNKLYFTKEEKEQLKVEYTNAEQDLKVGLKILQTYATNNKKKFATYESHSDAMMGWVLEETKERKYRDLKLERLTN